MYKYLPLLVLLFSGNTLASNDTSKSEIYSSICAVAKNKGFNAAKSFAKEKGTFISKHYTGLYCNGVPLKQFATLNTSNHETNSEAGLAGDKSNETSLCVEVLNKGIKAVSRKTAEVKGIHCNGVEVSEFLKVYGS